MKPKRDRLNIILDVFFIAVFVIGPFFLERSDPDFVPWLAPLMTALAGLLGFSVFRVKRRVYFFVALGVNVIMLDLLINTSKSLGPTYYNWAGGFLAGLLIGVWPLNRDTEEEERQNREPAPGWHLNNQEFAAVSMLTDRALAAFRDLDGAAHYFLCVTFGPSRIDIVGHYHGGLVVLCTPDIHDSKNWSILTGPDTNQQIFEFNAGPDHTKLPANNLVDAALAHKALEYFIAYQKPAPTLAWFTGPKVYARRPRSTRVLSEKTWAKEDSHSALATARPEPPAKTGQDRKDK